MPTLSSSIVQRKVASVRDVEEALARQVLYGGDLVTNLLDLASVSEAALLEVIAENFGLRPGPAGELPPLTPELRKLVPADVAAEFRFFPLSQHGNELEVAVAEPLHGEVQQDLCFSLGLSIVQRATSLARLREALARDFDVPLDQRTQRVIAKLAGRAVPSTPFGVSPATLPRPPSLPAPGSGLWPDAAEEPVPPAEVLPLIVDTPIHTPVPPATRAPQTEAALRARVEVDEPVAQDDIPTPYVPQVIPVEAFGDIPLPKPPEAPQPDPPLPEAEPARRVPPATRTLLSVPRPDSVPPRPSRRPRRLGPYIGSVAERDLQNAETRDAVLDTFFDYCSQYFEYCALFAVHGDIAEGRDAAGAGADRARVAAIGVPLDLPSALSAARDAGTFLLIALARDGIDAALAVDLERQPGRLAFLLPIMVRGRCVLLLYGDHGDRDVALSSVADLIAFAPLVSAALERVIRKRKLAAQRATQTPSQPPAPSQPPPSPREQAAPAPPSMPPSSQGSGAVTIQRIREVGPSSPPPSAPDSSPQPIPLTRRSTPPQAAPAPAAPTLPRLVEAELSPPSLSLAHAARPLKPPLEPNTQRLPSVIVDMTGDTTPLLDRLLAGDSQASAEVAAGGEAAASMLAALLPGPITSPLRQGTGGGPARASECGPVLRTLAKIGVAAVPAVITRTSAEDPHVRAWAARLLGEMPCGEAAQAVASGIVDDEAEVRRGALAAGRMLQGDGAAREALRETLLAIAHDERRSEDTRVIAIEALEDVRDAGAVPALIGLLAAESRQVAASSIHALRVLSRQDFGPEVQTWRRWWDENGHRHRVEWLIDALMHEVAEVRRAAGDELKSVTKEYFGYYDDLPLKERGRAQQRYRDWWDTKGKARFR